MNLEVRGGLGEFGWSIGLGNLRWGIGAEDLVWGIGLGDFEKLIVGWNVNTGLGGFGKVSCGLGREYWFGGCGGWIWVDLGGRI